MVRAEHAGTVGEQFLEGCDGGLELAGFGAPGGDVVARRERVGMVRAEHAGLVGEQVLEGGDGGLDLAGFGRGSRRCCGAS
jgi:hypothetical protein